MSPNLHAIVPAAGSGSRFGARLPKQFVALAGKTVLARALAAVLADARVAAAHVAGARNRAGELGAAVRELPAGLGGRVQVHRCGGAARAHSVLAAARLAAQQGADWLLVHDAARPLLHPDDLAQVIDRALGSGEPALLAAPLADTLKLARAGKSAGTVDRSDKWVALTPQLAPAGALCAALARHPDATDEAQALEREGAAPQLVAARHPNPKLTGPADLHVALALLAGRQKDAGSRA